MSALAEQIAWVREAIDRAEASTAGSFLRPGPHGFEAYAVIPHRVSRPTPTNGQVSDIDRVRRVVGELVRLERGPDEFVVALWTGVDQPAVDRSWTLIELSVREYAVRLCSLRQVDEITAQAPADLPPALVWATDQRWIVWSDIDLDWSGVGGSTASVQALCSAGLAVPMPSPPPGPDFTG